jgi:signal transduction histidine kinase
MAIRPVDNDPADVLLRERLVRALESCASEAELTQTLYQFLHPVFGYDVVSLHVPEKDGSYHVVPVDQGVLQERVRRPMERSVTLPLYQKGKTAVLRPDRNLLPSRGPGHGQEPNLLIWVPIAHRGELIASVLYECVESRHVPSRELVLLEEVHKELGPLVANAYLHEVTRDQAARLAALNDVARALAPTRDREEVLEALRHALGGLIAVDSVEVVEGSGPARIERTAHGATAWLPLREGGREAGLVVRTPEPDAHDDTLLAFLQGVADQLALALRNAESRAAEREQRRRVEVVSAVGRRLASSLDRWAIMRTLREELALQLEFDIFIVATVRRADSGPVAEGFAYDSGGEQWLPAVPLAMAGPARSAYESGRTVSIDRAPWAEAVESAHAPEDTWVMGEGAAVFITRPAGTHQAARSVTWVPVSVRDAVGALLSIQAYRPNAFSPADVKLLEDLAPYVGLALANAEHFEASKAESHRLEALHRVQLGLAGAADPEQVVRAALDGMRFYLPGDRLQIELREPGGRSRGFELTPEDELLEVPVPLAGAAGGGRRRRADSATGTVWLPLQEAGRSVGVLRAERVGGGRFTPFERDFLSAVSPLVGLALARLELAEAKELMLRAIGHEIRNPAAAMSATLSSLLEWDQAMDSGRRELLLGEAHGMSERLLALVEAQLLIAKLELGGFEPQPREVDVVATTRDVITLLSHRYDGAADVEVDAPAAPPKALCEPVHLQQVLTNLVGNAFEHGRPPVRIRIHAKESALEIGVIDSGPGPSPELAATLFERRLRGSRSRGGLGLGLYLCRLVVERSFGGRVWVRRLPRGVAFKFTVPRA